ncbi:hypothetical protein A2U01_0042420, partial [Trifolium medium]|nr:hypothetical protein [Trifolium medium]
FLLIWFVASPLSGTDLCCFFAIGSMSVSALPFVCPWTCLASAPPNPSTTPPSVVSNRSFPQVLQNKVDVSVAQLPKPCLKGNSLQIKISKEVYQCGLPNCNKLTPWKISSISSG